MCLNYRSKTRTANLLFALEEELQVDGRLPLGAHKRLNPTECSEEIPLIIGCPTGINPSIAYRRFKRWRLPEVEWIGRLDVIMAIEQCSRLGRIDQPLAIDNRITFCRQELDVGYPNVPQALRNPLRRAPHVVLMLW